MTRGDSDASTVISYIDFDISRDWLVPLFSPIECQPQFQANNTVRARLLFESVVHRVVKDSASHEEMHAVDSATRQPVASVATEANSNQADSFQRHRRRGCFLYIPFFPIIFLTQPSRVGGPLPVIPWGFAVHEEA